MSAPDAAVVGGPLGGDSCTDETFVYDGSFAGFLCVVVEAFRRAARPARIVSGEPDGAGLFGRIVRVETDADVAERAGRRLDRRTEGRLETLYHAFLSEAPGIEVALVQLIGEVLARGASAMEDLRFGPALAVERWKGRVRREVHRMHAFVRFEAREGGAEGGFYVARIRPDGHVLPLVGPHFEARYPALRWAIVDDRRGLALVHTPVPERADGEPAMRFAPAAALGEGPAAADEAAYQAMWRAYVRSVNIPERRNLRLHLRHVPRRYWPYLIEKREAPRP